MVMFKKTKKKIKTEMPMLNVQTPAEICDQLFSKSDTLYDQSL